ncbi:hypothetical protein GCM10009813_32090 [Brevibacterium marinum]
MSIGTGGTTDIHIVNFTGCAECAWRLQTLPIAQPKAPARVSRNGRKLAFESRRCHPTTPSPAMAMSRNTICEPRTRSRRKVMPSSTVNGPEACRTSEARPVGIPVAIAQ